LIVVKSFILFFTAQNFLLKKKMENKKWNYMHSAGGKFNEIPGVLADE
jgi:hypothetical protein